MAIDVNVVATLIVEITILDPVTSNYVATYICVHTTILNYIFTCIRGLFATEFTPPILSYVYNIIPYIIKSNTYMANILANIYKLLLFQSE